MTVSINDDKDQITITSSLLETPWSGITSVTLEIKKECTTTTSKTFTIEEDDITGSGSYTFTNTEAGFDFTQAVYGFTLKVVSSDSTTKEYYCFLVDVDLSCRVKSVAANAEYTKNDRMYIMLLYYQLTQPNLCHKSNCSDYCTIFNELTNELSMLSC